MEFSPTHRKSSAKGRCIVKNCDSTKQRDLHLSFHRVPQFGKHKIARKNVFGNIELVDKREEWLRKLAIKDNSKDIFVCSLHFSPNDYNLPHFHAKLRILKKDAVPKQVIISNFKEDKSRQRQQRATNRQAGRGIDQNASSTGKSNNSTQDDVTTQNDVKLHESLNDEEPEDHDLSCEGFYLERDPEPQVSNGYDDLARVLANYDNYTDVNTNVRMDEDEDEDEDSSIVDEINCDNQEYHYTTFQDKNIQVSSGDITSSFLSNIRNEKDLITMCNIQSFAILDELTAIFEEVYPMKRKRLLTARECIVLVLVKLKLDIPFNAIGVLFKLDCDVTTRNIFYDTLKKLSSILQSLIFRAPKEEIQRNMPKCFNNFSQTTSVLDCTEIKIQTPKCLKCRIKFYSHYKGNLTVKFMTEVTPAGLITYVSEPFGGRASDKTIFNHSGILEHLESTRDAVMVDKGFLIDNECAQKRINLFRPPFLRNKKQFSEEEALKNKQIASARVHIERMNQRIKQFQLLNNTVPWYMINYVEDIFIICCGLANLGTPILGDDKYK